MKTTASNFTMAIYSSYTKLIYLVIPHRCFLFNHLLTSHSKTSILLLRRWTLPLQHPPSDCFIIGRSRVWYSVPMPVTAPPPWFPFKSFSSDCKVSGVRSPARAGNYLFSTNFRPSLGHTNLQSNRYRRIFPWDRERWYETNLSCSCNSGNWNVFSTVCALIA